MDLFARYRKGILCGGLLLLMGCNLLSVIRRKSLTNDEYYHIPAGYYYLSHGNFKLNEEHPPLVKMWAALPLLVVRTPGPPLVQAPAEDPLNREHETFSQFWSMNLSESEAIAFRTRVPMILLTLALGVLIFVYARQLFGGRAALFAVLFFSLEPTVLAHGRIVQTDLPAALAYLLFFFSLRSFLRAPDLRRAFGLGGALGLALLTKFSLLILLPVFLIASIAMLWSTWQRGAQPARLGLRIAIALVVMLFLVNTAYYFRRQPLSQSDIMWIESMSPSHSGVVMRTLRAGSAVVPTSFLFGAYIVWAHDQMGHPASLLGAYSNSGWWYYFPVAFALKTSLPFLMLSIAAVGWALWMFWLRRESAFLWLLAPIVIYTLVAMTSHIDIGIRHLLPIFPFLFILSGAFVDWVLRLQSGWIPRAVMVVLLAWMALTAARAYPDYLTYMNEIASKHPHWYYLSDSNVEWGDDTGALAAYLCARGETSVRTAVLGGWTSPGSCGVQYVNAFSPEFLTQTRYVAIGASFLNGSTVPQDLKNSAGAPLTEEQRHNFFDAYRQRTPEAVFGNSIYLYREHE
jgi:Dolichyl-phosphate-mannose-protein mannosyltransferase